MPDDILTPSSANMDMSALTYSSNDMLSPIYAGPAARVVPPVGEMAANFTQSSGNFAEKRWCARCSRPGKPVRLKLCQINFEEAIYICTTPSCQFPLLEDNLEFFIVQRSLSQMVSMQKRKRKPDNHAASDNLKRQRLMSMGSTMPNLPAAVAEKVVSPACSEIIERTSVEEKNQPTAFVNLSAVARPPVITGLPSTTAQSHTLLIPCNPNREATDHAPESLAADSCNFSQSDFGNTNLVSSSPGSKCDSAKIKPHKVTTPTNFKVFIPKETLSAVRVEGSCSSLKSCELSSETSTQLIETRFQKTSNQPEETNQDTCISAINAVKLEELGPPLKYQEMIQWQNESSLCWLDVLLQCIVNSSNARAALNCSWGIQGRKDYLFHRLCQVYDNVQSNHHSDTSQSSGDKQNNSRHTEGLLLQFNQAREYIFKTLQKRFSLGQDIHESVVEMFPNLIRLDPVLKCLFSVQMRWEFECEECQHRRVHRSTTTIISFPSVTPDFHPLNATFLRPCFKCFAQDQLMNMVMEVFPPCLIMHFQQGLPHNRIKVLDFGIQGNLYSVCAVVQYINNPFNHFIVWIRDCKTNKWLCSDDLLEPVCKWQTRPPKIPPKEIHLVMWEKQGLESPLTPPHGVNDLRRSHLQHIRNEEALSSDVLNFLEPSEESCETIVLDDDAEKGDQQRDETDNITALKEPECSSSEAEPQTTILGSEQASSVVDADNDDADDLPDLSGHITESRTTDTIEPDHCDLRLGGNISSQVNPENIEMDLSIRSKASNCQAGDVDDEELLMSGSSNDLNGEQKSPVSRENDHPLEKETFSTLKEPSNFNEATIISTIAQTSPSFSSSSTSDQSLTLQESDTTSSTLISESFRDRKPSEKQVKQCDLKGANNNPAVTPQTPLSKDLGNSLPYRRKLLSSDSSDSDDSIMPSKLLSQEIDLLSKKSYRYRSSAKTKSPKTSREQCGCSSNSSDSEVSGAVLSNEIELLSKRSANSDNNLTSTLLHSPKSTSSSFSECEDANLSFGKWFSKEIKLVAKECGKINPSCVKQSKQGLHPRVILEDCLRTPPYANTYNETNSINLQLSPQKNQKKMSVDRTIKQPFKSLVTHKEKLGSKKNDLQETPHQVVDVIDLTEDEVTQSTDEQPIVTEKALKPSSDKKSFVQRKGADTSPTRKEESQLPEQCTKEMDYDKVKESDESIVNPATGVRRSQRISKIVHKRNDASGDEICEAAKTSKDPTSRKAVELGSPALPQSASPEFSEKLPTYVILSLDKNDKNNPEKTTSENVETRPLSSDAEKVSAAGPDADKQFSATADSSSLHRNTSENPTVPSPEVSFEPELTTNNIINSFPSSEPNTHRQKYSTVVKQALYEYKTKSRLGIYSTSGFAAPATLSGKLNLSKVMNTASTSPRAPSTITGGQLTNLTPNQHSSTNKTSDIQTLMKRVNSAEFRKLQVNSGRKSTKLLNSGHQFESYKPKRVFKLAGYKKANLKRIGSDLSQKPYQTNSRQAHAELTQSTTTSSRESSEKSSDISDSSDLMQDFSQQNKKPADIQSLVSCDIPTPYSACSASLPGNSPYTTPAGSVTAESDAGSGISLHDPFVESLMQEQPFSSFSRPSTPVTSAPTPTSLDDLIDEMDFTSVSEADLNFPASEVSSVSSFVSEGAPSNSPSVVGEAAPPLDLFSLFDL
ncbi:uncharacterized protein LOC143454828 isoform X1 [Clavelina lepadiformis]|uniref:uncharacterized protein LOC143454828 isoform X1 n=2 Tax=Clavelina lepadiformis TaxID=159417 RepID=UPI004042CB86